MRIAIRPALCCALLALVSPLHLHAEEQSPRDAALASISEKELKAHVEVLADDIFEGREAGTRGGHAAGGYLVQQFKKLDIPGAAETGRYFQTFGNGYRNILAVLEGSDPVLKHEIVVICGHYDHVGYGSPRNSFGPIGYIHNGADDNASGISAILELAEAYSSLPIAPRRTLVFAFWDGEEKGLLGSKHWVENPTFDLERVVMTLNVDMIGRVEKDRLEVYGVRSGKGLRELTSIANFNTRLNLDFTWELKDNSDHFPFYEKSIPVLMLHSGLHNDYHRPSDDAHLLNYAGMQRVAKMMYEVVERVANGPSIEFRPESSKETKLTQATFEKPAPTRQPRLGLSWQVVKVTDPTGQQRERFIVTRVFPGSPAAENSIHVGDELLQLDGWKIDNDLQLRQRLLARKQVDLTVQPRDGAGEQSKQLTLQGAPIRLGCSIREDKAAPGVLLITRVDSHSPAYFSGLKVGDRIYRFNDLRFANAAEFLQMSRDSEEEAFLLIERGGRLFSAKIAPLQDPAAPQAKLSRVPK